MSVQSWRVRVRDQPAKERDDGDLGDYAVVELPRRRREDRPQRRQRKGMYILPSLFTTANLAAGYYAILQAMHATVGEPWHFDFAAKAIGFAVLFDGLDGRIARMTNTSSDFGRELDSLADVITFGVAPAVLAYMWGFHLLPQLMNPELHTKLGQFGAVASFLFLMAGASRLARFNIHDESAALESGTSRQKIFRGHADSSRCWCYRGGGAFHPGSPAGESNHGDHRIGIGSHRGLPHGEHLALLQF